jgi:hypothetical protein
VAFLYESPNVELIFVDVLEFIEAVCWSVFVSFSLITINAGDYMDIAMQVSCEHLVAYAVLQLVALTSVKNSGVKSCELCTLNDSAGAFQTWTRYREKCVLATLYCREGWAETIN